MGDLLRFIVWVFGYLLVAMVGIIIIGEIASSIFGGDSWVGDSIGFVIVVAGGIAIVIAAFKNTRSKKP